MIPAFDVDVWIEPIKQLRVLSLAEAEDGWLINRAYSWIGVMPWDEVRTTLEEEREAVAAADAASKSIVEFEDFLRELEDRDEPPGLGLDIGVAGLTFALNASGFLTGWSCRGHHLEAERGEHPHVVFVTDRGHLGRLEPLAREANCGLAPCDVGSVIVWAPSVQRTMQLAEILVRESAVFDALPMVPFSDDDLEANPDSN